MRIKSALLALALCFCASAHAATYYVAKGGLDAHTGLAANCADTANAWLTIGHAVSSYAAGDTVNVCDGTYAEQLSPATNGSAGNIVTFQSVNKWGAKLTPADCSGCNLINIGANYFTFKNFEVTGTPNEGTTIKCNGANFCSIIGNKVHDSGVQSSVCNSGAALQTTGDNDSTIGNYAYNIGVPRAAGFRCNQFHAIYMGNGQNFIIQNNIFFEVWQGYAIHLNPAGNMTGGTVSGNLVFNVGDNAHNSGGALMVDCHTTSCDNNTFTDNLFVNVQESGRACIWEVQETGAIIGTHNVYSANGEYNCPTNIWVTGNTNAGFSLGPAGDPLFVNYTGDETGDYHITASSPEKNAGVSLGAPATDFDGLSRPQGIAYDIGPYEFPLAAGPPAAPAPGMFSFLTLQLLMFAFAGIVEDA
jgi:hypothetical protein